ncbi:MAG: iron-sulfur cluster assembly protein [Bacteroidota bacterium]|nr:iron-sulfur cluster assembly protein [Bacteroidota bacterium]
MILNINNVLNALKVVIDPDLHKDIVSLGFVKDIKGGSKN